MTRQLPAEGRMLLAMLAFYLDDILTHHLSPCTQEFMCNPFKHSSIGLQPLFYQVPEMSWPAR